MPSNTMLNYKVKVTACQRKRSKASGETEKIYIRKPQGIINRGE